MTENYCFTVGDLAEAEERGEVPPGLTLMDDWYVPYFSHRAPGAPFYLIADYCSSYTPDMWAFKPVQDRDDAAAVAGMVRLSCMEWVKALYLFDRAAGKVETIFIAPGDLLDLPPSGAELREWTLPVTEGDDDGLS